MSPSFKMKYGILINPDTRILFEEINRRGLCPYCQNSRGKYSLYDKKHNNVYSNLLPGFSSTRISIPVDILVIAEAHGGGRTDTFRSQLRLDNEVQELGNYYLNEPLRRFHQSEMRTLFASLNTKEKSWIFTDFIKCFVWQGENKQKELHGAENKRIAMRHCKQYLDNQISILKPRQILCLGKTVAKNYFNIENDFEHGSKRNCKKDSHSFELILSYFPSKNTADLWTEYEGWKKILQSF